MNKLIKSTLVLAMMAVATPALADNDDYIYAQNRGQYISYEAAAQKAVAHVGGGFAKDVDFEYKSYNNRAFFEVEVINKSGQEYDENRQRVVRQTRLLRLICPHIHSGTIRLIRRIVPLFFQMAKAACTFRPSKSHSKMLK